MTKCLRSRLAGYVLLTGLGCHARRSSFRSDGLILAGVVQTESEERMSLDFLNATELSLIGLSGPDGGE